ncbi:MAG: hypothetical protein ABL995_16285 [Bryobacteraceae bacterium]
MRAPTLGNPADLEPIPDRPAVFLLWASEGTPYLARTALLRRRLKRLLGDRDRISRVLNLNGVVERIEYWRTGSQLESSILYLDLAQKYFPDSWQKITRLRPPAFVRLTTDNQFPRTMVTTRLGRGISFGPFPSRAAAERFDNEMLDLFQLRRCEENLNPTPEHPGCIYGEMNRCLRPCQQAVSMDEYKGESARVEQFLRTNGASLREPAEDARDRASGNMDFEEAERLHQRVERISQVQSSAGDLARTLDRLAGVAVLPSRTSDAIDLLFLIGGRWQSQVRLALSEVAGAGQSMDHRLRDIVAAIEKSLSDPAAERMTPNMEHLSILMRWYTSSWRDGEWIDLDWPAKIPYRKLVNAIARVSNPSVPSAPPVPSVKPAQ